MSAEENKVIARRYYREIMNEGNLAVIDELIAPDFVFSIPTHPEPFHGPEGFKQLVTMLHTAFPDLHLTVEHILAQGDTVVGHWTGSGTHTGGPLHTVMGDIQANGRAFTIDGMTWFRIVNGKIAESLANEDSLGMLIQLGVIPSQSAPPPTDTTQENETIVSRYFNEVMNQGKIEVVDEIAAANFAFRIPTLPEPVRSPEGLKQFVTGLRKGFPDIHFTVEREIADGEKVAVRWTITGTHLGTFLGVPPSGKKVKDQGIDIFHIVNGKLLEIWVNENDLGLMQQIGVLPSPVNETPSSKGQIGTVPPEGAPEYKGIEANKAVIHRFFDELWNGRKTGLIDDLVIANHRIHFPAGQAHHIQSMQEWTKTAFAAFPDVYFTVDEIIAEGDRVMCRWHYDATQTGDFLGIPPTGIRVMDEGMDVFRLEGGKIAEIWVIQDSLGLLEQLGVIPMPGK